MLLQFRIQQSSRLVAMTEEDNSEVYDDSVFAAFNHNRVVRYAFTTALTITRPMFEIAMERYLNEQHVRPAPRTVFNSLDLWEHVDATPHKFVDKTIDTAPKRTTRVDGRGLIKPRSAITDILEAD
jgi:hypothetical protein